MTGMEIQDVMDDIVDAAQDVIDCVDPMTNAYKVATMVQVVIGTAYISQREGGSRMVNELFNKIADWVGEHEVSPGVKLKDTLDDPSRN